MKIFLQRPTIALLLHRIYHVAQCVYILTKAMSLFILFLKISYVELMVGEMEACTCVTYIAKSNIGSTEMTYHTSSWKLCKCVEGEWWKWNTPFMKLSLSFEDTREWLCLFFFLDSYLSKKNFNTRTFMGPLSFLFFSCGPSWVPFL